MVGEQQEADKNRTRRTEAAEVLLIYEERKTSNQLYRADGRRVAPSSSSYESDPVGFALSLESGAVDLDIR